MCFIILFNPLLGFLFFSQTRILLCVEKKVNATFIKKGEIRVNNYFFEPACAACHCFIRSISSSLANSINFAINFFPTSMQASSLLENAMLDATCSCYLILSGLLTLHFEPPRPAPTLYPAAGAVGLRAFNVLLRL